MGILSKCVSGAAENVIKFLSYVYRVCKFLLHCGICVQYPLEVDAIGFNESRLFSHWVIVHMRYHSDYSHT